MSSVSDDHTELSKEAIAALLEFYAEQEQVAHTSQHTMLSENWVSLLCYDNVTYW